MAEPADRTALLVGAEHALAKATLVQALPDHRRHILPPRGKRSRVVGLPGGRHVDLGVDRHDEGEGLGVILDDEDRPRRFIEAGDDTVQVDEGRLALHGRPQPEVVSMTRIGASIAIAKEAGVGEAVVVGALAVLDRRGGCDGEGDIGEDGGLEDALRTDQRDAGAVEVEAAFEDGAEPVNRNETVSSRV
jgi:hypothetical protein